MNFVKKSKLLFNREFWREFFLEMLSNTLLIFLIVLCLIFNIFVIPILRERLGSLFFVLPPLFFILYLTGALVERSLNNVYENQKKIRKIYKQGGL